jgi:hypothetical protein
VAPKLPYRLLRLLDRILLLDLLLVNGYAQSKTRRALFEQCFSEMV